MTAVTNRPLKRLGFLTIGLFDPDNPRPGHETTLELIELGERLGFDSAWVRQRHLQHGISSPVALLAAASQRTSRIDLGTAVIPLGWENPLRLAEDLATVDVLSGGRLNPGVSVGAPSHFDDVKQSLYPDTADQEDFSYARVTRLVGALAGEPQAGFEESTHNDGLSRKVQPHADGLAARVWYGGGSLRSAEWAGRAGLNFLTSNVISGEGAASFHDAQARQIDAFRQVHPDSDAARVSQGRVVIPTDNATPEQIRKYRQYAAERTERTLAPQGPRGFWASLDLVGPSAEIAEALLADPGFQRVEEVAFALPFTFDQPDYEQILTDIASGLAPLLGWEGPQRGR